MNVLFIFLVLCAVFLSVCQAGCYSSSMNAGTYSVSSGTTLNLGSPYSPNMFCEWIYYCSPSWRKIKVILNGPMQSGGDVVLMKDTSSFGSTLFSVSGTRSNSVYTTGVNKVYIKFTSDGSAEYSGYTIAMKCVCTAANDCSGYGTLTTTYQPCGCSCNSGYGGGSCSTCATNWMGYPTCYKTPCSTDYPNNPTSSYCNEHGTVSGNRVNGCSCSCSLGYDGATCSACAAGCDGYPVCVCSPTKTPTLTLRRTATRSLSAFTASFSPTLTSPITASHSRTFTSAVSQTLTHPLTLTLTTPRTLSPSLPVSASVSKSISLPVTPTLSVTLSHTPPPTPTNSPTHSVSLTGTITPPETPTGSSSVTLSPSFSTSLFPTLSDSISPSTSPSPTASISETLLLTITETESPTTSMTQTQTVSNSPTPSFTTSLSLTETETITSTLSSSKEVYCAGLPPQECTSLPDLCNMTEESSCVAQDCTAYSGGHETCSAMGCNWKQLNQWEGKCSSPPQCRDIFDAEECQGYINCRWDVEIDACRYDTVKCSEQLLKTKCTGARCSWNSVTDPHCFKPIVVSALCRMVSHPLVCISAKCLWLDSMGICEPWDVTCEDISPHPSSCPLIPLCFFDASKFKCMSAESIDFESMSELVIVSASSPSQVFPGQLFDASFLGKQLTGENPVFLVQAESCPAGNEMGSVQNFTIKYYDFDLKSSVVQVTAESTGVFRFCIKANATHILGPFGTVNITLTDPVILSCGTSPSPTLLQEKFKVEILHDIVASRPDPLSKIALVVGSTTCPNSSSSLYVPVLDIRDSSVAVADYITNDKGNYTICIMNRGLNPVKCPNKIEINKLPRWYDPEVIHRIAINEQEIPKILGRTIIDFNHQYCKSMSDGNRTDGVAIHPNSMPLKYGDGITPVVGNEVCAYAIKPAAEGWALKGEVIFLGIHYVSLGVDEEVRIFVAKSGAQSATPPCNTFDTSRSCRKTACYWDETQNACIVQIRDIGNCPNEISNHDLLRVIDYKAFSGTSGKLSLPMTSQGGIAVVCSPNAGSGALGVSFVYHVASTQCPNDCTDIYGNTNGICEQTLDSEGYECRCNAGFTGADCSRRSICRGVGTAADTIRSADASETFNVKGDACGIILEVDPDGAPRMQRYGIALSIRNIKTSPRGSFRSNIILRKGSYLGPPIFRLSPEIINADNRTEKYRALVEDSHSIYMEFEGAEGDSFEVRFLAVSLICPGKFGTSGYPLLPSEICHGKGECVKRDYNQGEVLPAAYECDCRYPFDSTFIGQTCDTCAFGFQADTFPQCLSATICANNCSFHGICIQNVGCLCDEGWYGLDCALADDFERLGELKSVLENRIPLNAKSAGNVVQSGSIDRTLMTCALPGSRRTCQPEARVRGRAYAQQDQKFSLTGFSRRRAGSQGGVNASSISALFNMSADDEGLQFNPIVTNNQFPGDFIRQENVSFTSRDIHGEFTAAGWVKITAEVKGFLVAKVDSAFYANGLSTVLDKALEDVADRGTPRSLLNINSELLNIHVGIVLNGPRKRVDLIVTNPEARNTSRTKEDWVYVRHFRLDEKSGDLFDGTWRFIGLMTKKHNRRLDAQVYVDGESKKNSDFLQCLPFLPVQACPAIEHYTNDSKVVVNMPGCSLIWGYRVVGAMDELHVYSSSLPRELMLYVGGGELLDFLFTARGRALALCIVGIIVLIVVIFKYKALQHMLYGAKQEKVEEEGEEGKVEKDPREKVENTSSPVLEVFEDDFQKPDVAPLGEDNPLVVTENKSERNDVAEETTAGKSVVQVLKIPSDDEAAGQTEQKEEVLNADGEALVNSTSMSPALEAGTVSLNIDAAAKLIETPQEVQMVADEALLQKTNEEKVECFKGGNEAVHCSPEDFGAISKYLVEIPDSENTKAANVVSTFLRNVSTRPEASEFFTNLNEFLAEDNEFLSMPNQCEDDIELRNKKMKDLEDKLGRAIGDAEKKAHLQLLDDIVDLREELEERKKKKDPTRRATDGPTENPKSTQAIASTAGGAIGPAVNSMLSSWQMLSQLSSAVSLPSDWENTWGIFAFTISMDFMPAFGAYYGIAFYILFSITSLCFIGLIICRCMYKRQSQSEVVTHLKKMKAEMQRCLDEDEHFYEPITKMERLVQILATATSILHSPMTFQAFVVLFCHPAISCIYDCYVEETHKTLMVFSGITLLFISSGVPIFYFIVVAQVKVQFHTYIGTYDTDLQENFWPRFTTCLSSPFASLYQPVRHSWIFFECLFLVFRLGVTALLAALEPESASQLILVMVFQMSFLVFIALVQPYHDKILNHVLFGSNVFFLLMLILRCSQIVYPKDSSVGVVMVVTCTLAIVAQIAACLYLFLKKYGPWIYAKVMHCCGKKKLE